MFTFGFKDGTEKEMGKGRTFAKGCGSDKVTTSMRVEMLTAYESEMLWSHFASGKLDPSHEVPLFIYWHKRLLRLRLSMMDSETEPRVPSGSSSWHASECVYNPVVADDCDDTEKINPFMLPRADLMAGLGYRPHEARCVKGALNVVGERTCPDCKAENRVH